MRTERFIEKLYYGKKRKTGHPFTSHMYAVKQALVNLGVSDEEVLEAALLHDVLEDTDLSKNYLALRFGERVAHIVYLLSKRDVWNTGYCKMKSNMDEMESAWIQYPEAIIIKMSDRLHNLQTIQGFSVPKQREYIQETHETLLPVFKMILEKVPLETYKKVVESLYGQLKKELQAIQLRLKTP
ncbi:MAG: HD domain-containing protein [Candidatus Gracilibacteria bacterium]|nr:HD domain-containing protein [Candidatus Gracilibacteria bacterium]